MPANPTKKPLITEVIKNDIPDAVPAIPLALSRFFSSTRNVITVVKAMFRIFPIVTPNNKSKIKSQSTGLTGFLKAAAGVSRYIKKHRLNRINEPRLEANITFFFL